MIVNITTFTLIHTLISLVAIVAGLVAVGGLMAGQRLDGWTGLFLVTTALTSITGFGFPFTRLLPSQYIGIISLIVLVPVIITRYRKHLEGAWREEPPYFLAQLIVMALFVALGFAAFRRFRPQGVALARGRAVPVGVPTR
jgi:hypothetical protein